MLTTRTITNAGSPLYSPGGVLLAGTAVTFFLADSGGMPTDAWDATTNERVGGNPITAITDAQGEFSALLWPNTRGNRTTKYKCRVEHPGFREFSGVVEDVPATLTWAEFMLSGGEMTAQEMSALAAAMAAHVSNADPHTQYAKEADLGTAAATDSTAYATAAQGATADTALQPDDGLGALDAAAATKLAGIAAGATANATDAQLRDRATHTGEQAISTVTGLAAALAGKEAAGTAAAAVASHAAAGDPHPQYTTAAEASAAIAAATAIHPFLLIGA